MNRGLVISGIGHLGLILWVFLGDWFFVPPETPPMQVASVSVVSAARIRCDVGSRAEKARSGARAAGGAHHARSGAGGDLGAARFAARCICGAEA